MCISRPREAWPQCPISPSMVAKRWRPGLAEGFKKSGKHEALADIYESIEELKYYREHFIRPA